MVRVEEGLAVECMGWVVITLKKKRRLWILAKWTDPEGCKNGKLGGPVCCCPPQSSGLYRDEGEWRRNQTSKSDGFPVGWPWSARFVAEPLCFLPWGLSLNVTSFERAPRAILSSLEGSLCSPSPSFVFSKSSGGSAARVHLFFAIFPTGVPLPCEQRLCIFIFNFFLVSSVGDSTEAITGA